MSILRNLARRKLRTALTIIGITVGIWALVVMLAMANKFSTIVEGGSTYFRDKIIVSDAATPAFAYGFAPLPTGVATEIEGIPGVAAAVPRVLLLLDPNDPGNAFRPPAFLVGFTMGADGGHETFGLEIAEGRLLSPEDEGEGVVLLGSDLARESGKRPGDVLEIRGEEFEIVGVREPTLMFFDTSVVIPLAAAQEILEEEAPILARTGLDTGKLASMVVVYPEAGVDPEILGGRIKEAIPKVRVVTGEEYDQQFGSALAIFNAIILSVALISLVVGGLSVINTMTMSVAERTREIGIKRSIGASQVRIMRELVTEAAVMGFVGGVLGLGLGVIVVEVGNEAGRASGTFLFHLTPAIGVFAVAFSTMLGAIAGAAPAWRASRLDPVDALRYE